MSKEIKPTKAEKEEIEKKEEVEKNRIDWQERIRKVKHIFGDHHVEGKDFIIQLIIFLMLDENSDNWNIKSLADMMDVQSAYESKMIEKNELYDMQRRRMQNNLSFDIAQDKLKAEAQYYKNHDQKIGK